jgi:hypothetical protein
MIKLDCFAFTSLLIVIQGLLTGPTFAADKPSAESSNGHLFTWQDDYGHAVRQAIEEHKMLVIYFEGPSGCSYCRKFEEQTLSDAQIEDQLVRFIALRLPSDAQITVDGKPVTLLRHAAFAEMLGRPGIAILDMTDKKSPNFHQVVSVLPFTSHRFATSSYASKQAVSTLLTLPAGTLTQRTMIFAVRMHPEAPASSRGAVDPTLSAEANSHSSYQATIGVQGHHHWDARFQRINGKLPSGLMAQEVVAESWPGENLVEACEDCVHSWRQSPGHWGAVRSWHPLFGYDIKRGRNGIWYATGIFGRR